MTGSHSERWILGSAASMTAPHVRYHGQVIGPQTAARTSSAPSERVSRS